MRFTEGVARVVLLVSLAHFAQTMAGGGEEVVEGVGVSVRRRDGVAGERLVYLCDIS